MGDLLQLVFSEAQESRLQAVDIVSLSHGDHACMHRVVPRPPDAAVVAARAQRADLAQERRQLPSAEDAERIWQSYEAAKAKMEAKK